VLAHEAHLNLKTSTRHRFFAAILLFLGGMDGVVLSNDMSFFYFLLAVLAPSAPWPPPRPGDRPEQRQKVLPYSTISNLGLIFVCAGLNTPEVFTASVLLIMFHAVIKTLLFLCIGSIKQHIDSRVEDMLDLYA
jgi:NADH:ubiquinone oxidoreductase subunit 5 (subunit L)/multisubunit Na+/H+ antiporter MnhA subunit